MQYPWRMLKSFVRTAFIFISEYELTHPSLPEVSVIPSTGWEISQPELSRSLRVDYSTAKGSEIL